MGRFATGHIDGRRRLERPTRATLLGLLLATGCAAPPGGGDADVSTLAAAPYPNLLSLARDLPIPVSGSEGFRAPTGADLTAFADLLAAAMAGRHADASAQAGGVGYDVWRLTDPSAAPLVVLAEQLTSRRGGGTFVINPNAARELVVEVPHPLSDAGTVEEGVTLFLRARARLLLIAGTHRCANNESTPCRGTESTNACGGRLRISDAAHFDATFFHVGHVQAFAARPGSLAVSLHAHASNGMEPDVMLSHGTRQTLAATAMANQLRDSLRAAGALVSSCHALGDSPRLCGEANVQGRYSNGVADACADDASATTGRFLHVEQSPVVLADAATIVEALSTLLPAARP